MKAKPGSFLVVLAVLAASSDWCAAPAADDDGWGAPVDGLVCRLVVQPRYVVGQAIDVVIEVKNTSNKKRYLQTILDPYFVDHMKVELSGPKGKVEQTFYARGAHEHEDYFRPMAPGDVKRFAVSDLRFYSRDLNEWRPNPAVVKVRGNIATPGKYTLRARFRSPKVPERFIIETFDTVRKTIYKEVPAEVKAGQWSGEITFAPATFELAALAKDDLVVHEWGVFTLFNDVKYANVNRKEEWGNLPSFFYRQFPNYRLRWVPTGCDKPVLYFYAKPTPLQVSVKVTFADQGLPVVWWPAAAHPVDDYSGCYEQPKPVTLPPFHSLVWAGWLGDRIPQESRGRNSPVAAVELPLPADCWLSKARLPGASRLTVAGRGDGLFETERFLYYDGLVPSPEYLRCEQVDDASITLRNRADFDLGPLFVVDRRAKGRVGFVALNAAKAGAQMKVVPRPIAGEDWPAAGTKQVRQALLDAGLFAAEANAVLTIWEKRLLEAEGVTVFHILPPREYDRMLPLDILPTPAAKPVRVGIALHPHMEIEPQLTKRVGDLIRQLGDPKFEKRDMASKALLEIGPLAIALLRAELRTGPPLETKRRIEAVLDRVDATAWLPLMEKGKKSEK